MLLLDELIEMLIGMNDEQLRKVKNFILSRLNIQVSDHECEIKVYHCPEQFIIEQKKKIEILSDSLDKMHGDEYDEYFWSIKKFEDDIKLC